MKISKRVIHNTAVVIGYAVVGMIGLTLLDMGPDALEPLQLIGLWMVIGAGYIFGQMKWNDQESL